MAVPTLRCKAALVIDDDPIISEVLASYLRQRGVETIAFAATGQEAVQALADQPNRLDIMTCDLNMPDYDGVEFLQHLNTIGSQVPIVIISSADNSVVEAAGMLARAHGLVILGVLKKPLKVAELDQALAPLATA